MIHSLAGGDFKINNFFTIAKVEILDGLFKSDKYWYISNLINLKVNDIVLVPVGKNQTPTKAKVLRNNKNDNEKISPIPIKKMKEIIKIINE